MEEEMKKLLDLGFKKVPTEDGFVMYELTPARLDSIKVELKKILKTNQEARSNKPQAPSGKQQAAGCDNLSHLHKKKTR
jgi:predicted PP-loop superfamily ATPase